MERKDFQTVGDVLRQALDESCMTDRIYELKAVTAWSAVVGPGIATRTLRPYVAKGVMTIRTPDAPLRHELMMQRSSIVKAINRTVGHDVITDIRFTS